MEAVQHDVVPPKGRGLCAGEGRCEEWLVAGRPFSRRAVGAIDRKVHEQLDQAASDSGARDVRATFLGFQLVKRAHTRFELRREAACKYFATRRVLLRLEGRWASADGSPGSSQQLGGAGVMQQGADLLHEVVAGGAVATPCVGQILAGEQDLFDDDVGMSLLRG